MISNGRSSPLFGSSAETASWAIGVSVPAVQILADTLIDARIVALQVKQRPHDIDVEFARLELFAGDDLVGEAQDEPCQLLVIECRVAEFVEIGGRDDFRVEHHVVRQPRQRRLPEPVGVVGLLERVHEAAQIEVGVVLHVGRHLRVAEIALARAMRVGSQGSQKMGFSGSRLAVKQQNSFLHVIAVPGRDGRQQIVEFLACLGVNFRHVDGVGAPEIIFPGDRMLKRFAQLVRRELRSERRIFKRTAFNAHFESGCLHSWTRTKCQTVFL